jgi:dipeptidyl aminopeptidase/acylaminoacyl peptidase
VSGDAVTVVENLRHDVLTRTAAYSVSAAGVLAYRAAARTPATPLAWFSREGKSLGILPVEGRHQNVRRPHLSPDGRRLAVTVLGPSGQSDIWLVDLDRNVPSRVTFDGTSDTAVWSNDGARIIYGSGNKGVIDLYERDAGGVAPTRLLFASQHDTRPWAVSPDGKVLLFGQAAQGNPEIWALPLTGDAKPWPVVQTGFPAGNAVFSPDGRWFAYCEGDSGLDQVYIQPFPPNGQRIRVSSTSGSAPQWSDDGNEITYMATRNMLMSVEVRSDRASPPVGGPRELFRPGRTFQHRAHMLDSRRGRLLLPASDGDEEPTPIAIVVNWRQELERARRQ